MFKMNVKQSTIFALDCKCVWIKFSVADRMMKFWNLTKLKFTRY